jgi:transposase/transposase-like protein
MRKKLLALTPAARRKLEQLVARRNAPADHVLRARIVLMSASGKSGAEIAAGLGVSFVHVSRVRTRFIEGGVDGLATRKKAGRKDHAVPVETVDRILKLALSPPPVGRSRWTTRLIAREVHLAGRTVSAILRKHEVKPHLLRTYKISRDPEFASKVHDIVGLYLNPPENAVVLSLDEKTQVQALERTQPPLPLRQGRATRHTHDYKRHGVIDLYAALNVESGEVVHACKDSHTAADFIAFMKQVARAEPRRELHVILDNSSTHSTPAVQAWLAKHPRVHFHYTPTSGSWLNQVEGFFGILAKQSLSLTNFVSKKALRAHLDAFMASWNERPTPFIWTKPAKAIVESHRKMINRISLPVH